MTDTVVDLSARRAGFVPANDAQPVNATASPQTLARQIARGTGPALLSLVRILWSIVRFTLATVMLWLRWPAQLALAVLALAGFVGTAIIYLGYSADDPEKAGRLTMAMGIGLGATALRIAYDGILAALRR